MTSWADAAGLGLVAAVLAWIGTAVVLRRAHAHGLLDHPNERSSHAEPTPRGGGLAIVTVVGLAMGREWIMGRLDTYLGLALLGGGLAVAVVGWIDDRHTMRRRWRGLTHTAAAIGVLYALGGLPELSLGTFSGRQISIPLGPAGWVIGTITIVWMTNLYNFMDGIDGLAAAEAVFVCVVGAVLIFPNAPGLAHVAIAVAGASAGFLAWNWSPARIFMGDVSSGFLGFMLGALALAAERAPHPSGSAPALLWLLLLTVFIGDAMITLLRRVIRGEQWYSAHRSHAYQRLVQSGWSHARVTTTVIGVNAVLAAFALVAIRRPDLTLVALVAGALLVVGCYRVVEQRHPMVIVPRLDVERGAS